MNVKELFLQRLAQPIAEDGVLRIENGFVEKRDGGEGSEAHVVGIISGGEAGAGGVLESFAGVVAEGIRIGDALAVAAQAFDGGKDFLKNKRQTSGRCGRLRLGS